MSCVVMLWLVCYVLNDVLLCYVFYVMSWMLVHNHLLTELCRGLKMGVMGDHLPYWRIGNIVWVAPVFLCCCSKRHPWCPKCTYIQNDTWWMWKFLDSECFFIFHEESRHIFFRSLVGPHVSLCIIVQASVNFRVSIFNINAFVNEVNHLLYMLLTIF